MSNELTIGKMSTDDLRIVLNWAAEEGWNPGLADAEAFHAADPYGFFMARVEGAPVAAVSVVNHDAENAFLGLYICHPDWRGQGIGFKTWTHGLAHAGQRSVGLDGVPDQEANYRASGFVKTGKSLRYVGRWPSRESPEIRQAESKDIAALVALDARANGSARPRFMTPWLDTVPSLRASRVLMEDGAIRGFATWRACQEGTKIGPVVAEDSKAALDLIADIAALRPDGPMIIDVPEANNVLRGELAAADFVVPFETARMYRGRVPEQHSSLQTIATMELG